MSDKDKSKYVIVPYGLKFQVVERSTDLILRTLDSKGEAVHFALLLEPVKKERKT